MDVLKYLQSKDPIYLLNQWIQIAQSHSQIKEPMAMSVSTVNHNAVPFSRMVLAKEITSRGVIFYTNQNSKKGVHLSHHPYCSLLFYWDLLFRQIHIQGKSVIVSREKTLSYWKTRPRQSQLSQWISQQSQPVADRDTLEMQFKVAEKQWMNQEIPCPEGWSGYEVIIENIEFWIGQNHRLHDRFLFKKGSDCTWSIERLYP